MWETLSSREMVAAIIAVLIAELGITGRGWWVARKERSAVRKLLEMEIHRDWRAFAIFWRDVIGVRLQSSMGAQQRSMALARRFAERTFPARPRVAWTSLLARIPESLTVVELKGIDDFYTVLAELDRKHSDLLHILREDAAEERAAPIEEVGGLRYRQSVPQRFARTAPKEWPLCEVLGQSLIGAGVPFPRKGDKDAPKTEPPAAEEPAGATVTSDLPHVGVAEDVSTSGGDV